jgi:hypothetical protein
MHIQNNLLQANLGTYQLLIYLEDHPFISNTSTYQTTGSAISFSLSAIINVICHLFHKETS